MKPTLTACFVGLVFLGIAAHPESARAQALYSVEAVGYVNVVLPPGFSLISNPLNAESPQVGVVFQTMSPEIVLFKFDEQLSQFTINTLSQEGWTDPRQSFAPGEGGFILNPSSSSQTISFVGAVPQGSLEVPIPAGLSIRSSPIPQAGFLERDLRFPAAEGDIIYQFDSALKTYRIHTYSLGQWDVEPFIQVAEAFFVIKIQPAIWHRQFSVNQP